MCRGGSTDDKSVSTLIQFLSRRSCSAVGKSSIVVTVDVLAGRT